MVIALSTQLCRPSPAPRHTDAVPAGVPQNPDVDLYNDEARSVRGPECCPFPGGNRHLTVLVYLNDVQQGGRTCWRWCESVGREWYRQPHPTGRVSHPLRESASPVEVSPREGMAVVSRRASRVRPRCKPMAEPAMHSEGSGPLRTARRHSPAEPAGCD